ncbi:DUF4224 domain-containing protein [Limnobaculum xujianqingii]|uniref:DUF4224 domain-containing protein n=1 Tax=Limnobaculum xujianqingii TaxID=2738837 RepID=UPI0011294D1F|nr:DUF4224 domain-containing protein [Limnobaculum xujianqingii]
MANEFLTVDEVIELTGFKKQSCQCEALTANGFSYAKDAEGRPKLTWTHVNAVLNGQINTVIYQDERPNFGAI